MRTDKQTNSPERAPRPMPLVVVGCVILIAALAVIPLFVTRDPHRQSTFAWEMYSKAAPRDEFLIFYESQERELVTVTDLQPRGVAPVDYTGVLPSFICRRLSEVVLVEVYRGDALIGVHECNE